MDLNDSDGQDEQSPQKDYQAKRGQRDDPPDSSGAKLASAGDMAMADDDAPAPASKEVQDMDCGVPARA